MIRLVTVWLPAVLPVAPLSRVSARVPALLLVEPLVGLLVLPPEQRLLLAALLPAPVPQSVARRVEPHLQPREVPRTLVAPLRVLEVLLVLLREMSHVEPCPVLVPPPDAPPALLVP